jgi:hypothetical protein
MAENQTQALGTTPTCKLLARPNPLAFSSTGALPKKNINAPLQRNSLPTVMTPQTPLKRERSKFVIPSNLTPFGLSPRHIIANSSGSPGLTKLALPDTKQQLPKPRRFSLMHCTNAFSDTSLPPGNSSSCSSEYSTRESFSIDKDQYAHVTNPIGGLVGNVSDVLKLEGDDNNEFAEAIDFVRHHLSPEPPPGSDMISFSGIIDPEIDLAHPSIPIPVDEADPFSGPSIDRSQAFKIRKTDLGPFCEESNDLPHQSAVLKNGSSPVPFNSISGVPEDEVSGMLLDGYFDDDEDDLKLIRTRSNRLGIEANDFVNDNSNASFPEDDPFVCSPKEYARYSESSSLKVNETNHSDYQYTDINSSHSNQFNNQIARSPPWRSSVPTFFTFESFQSQEWLTNRRLGSKCNEPPCFVRPQIRYHHQSSQSSESQIASISSSTSMSSEPDIFCRSHENMHDLKPIASNRFFEENFDVLGILGRGSFSDVFRVSRKIDGASFALKKSKHPFTGLVDMNRRLQEVESLWLASGCSNCLQIYCSWEHNGYLFILTELCENGSLYDVIEYMAGTGTHFSEFQIWQILRQIALGLEHIHRSGVVHLDIKPANIMITQDGTLRIGDFGLSTRPGHYLQDPDAQGDKYYMAPETLDGIYEQASDIFSLGLVILELLTDIELPAHGPSWQKLRHGDFSELPLDGVSSELQSLIRRMLNPESGARPTVRQLLNLINSQS